MAFSLVAHSLTQSPDSNGVTSGALNTTGADLIVLGVASYAGTTAPTINDSKGNAWTPATVVTDGTLKRLQFYYCQSPVVGAGHTFSAAGTGDFDAISVSAWSGSAGTPLDQQAGNATSATPGSVTPTVDNEVVITIITDASAGVVDNAVSGGFTIPDACLPNISGQAFGIGMAYLIQTTAAAANPTWSGTGTQPGSAIITFKASAGGGTDTPFNVSPGSFTLTGSPATMNVGLNAAPGSFAETGSPATLDIGLDAAPGSFALTGSPALLGIALDAAPGSFTLTGFPADLLVSGNFVLDAAPGSFTLTGSPAALDVGLAAGPGAFAEVGSPVTFGVGLDGSPGVFALTGFPASLVATGLTAAGRVITIPGRDLSGLVIPGTDRSKPTLPTADLTG